MKFKNKLTVDILTVLILFSMACKKPTDDNSSAAEAIPDGIYAGNTVINYDSAGYKQWDTTFNDFYEIRSNIDSIIFINSNGSARYKKNSTHTYVTNFGSGNFWKYDIKKPDSLVVSSFIYEGNGYDYISEELMFSGKR